MEKIISLVPLEMNMLTGSKKITRQINKLDIDARDENDEDASIESRDLVCTV